MWTSPAVVAVFEPHDSRALASLKASFEGLLSTAEKKEALECSVSHVETS